MVAEAEGSREAAPSEGGGAGEEADRISSDDNIRGDSLPLPVCDNICQKLMSSSIRPKGDTNSETLSGFLPEPIP